MITIKLTKEVIDVFPMIMAKTNEDGITVETRDLFYVSDVLHTILMAWGKFDNHIKDTEKTLDGRRWEYELEQKAWDTYEFIKNNLEEIVNIIFTFSNKGGVKPGVYKRKESETGLYTYSAK
jgi:hypothetical protein